MGFQKEVALPAVLIRVGFPKEESFHISLNEIGPHLICGVYEVPETEIYWENLRALKEKSMIPRCLAYTWGIAEALRKLCCDPELSS